MNMCDIDRKLLEQNDALHACIYKCRDTRTYTTYAKHVVDTRIQLSLTTMHVDLYGCIYVVMIPTVTKVTTCTRQL